MSYVPALRAYYRVARGAFGLRLEVSRTATTERDWTALGPLRFDGVPPDAAAAALLPHTVVAPDGSLCLLLLVVGYTGYVTAYHASYDRLLSGRRVIWRQPVTLTGPQSGAAATADVVLTTEGWLLMCGRIRVLLDVERHDVLDSWLVERAGVA